MLRRDEKVVLQQIAGEEQPMPLIVGKLLGEMFDFVCAALGLALAIAQLPGLGTKLASQTALPFAHVPVGVGLVHGKCFERMARTTLCDVASLRDRACQLAAQLSGQAAQRITGPSLSLASTC